MASATFEFSHPCRPSVDNPVGPVTENLSQRGRGAPNAGSALSFLLEPTGASSRYALLSGSCKAVRGRSG